MDVVDFAQPRECAMGGEIESYVVAGLAGCAHRSAKSDERQALSSPRARNPGADGVDEMQLDRLAHGIGGRRASRNRAGQPFECAHGAACADDQSTSLPCA